MRLKSTVNKLIDKVHKNELITGYDTGTKVTVTHSKDGTRKYDTRRGEVDKTDLIDKDIPAVIGQFSQRDVLAEGSEILLTDTKIMIRRKFLSQDLTKTAVINHEGTRYSIAWMDTKRISQEPSDYVVAGRRF